MNVDLLRKPAVLAASAVFTSNHDAFADVIVGLPASTTEGNCIPFGCVALSVATLYALRRKAGGA